MVEREKGVNKMVKLKNLRECKFLFLFYQNELPEKSMEMKSKCCHHIYDT